MPCLNEHETVGVCVQKAVGALTQSGLAGEVIVADNGSTDGSMKIAESLGARVAWVRARGYGHALRGDILAARGRYVIMGDADDSYDAARSSGTGVSAGRRSPYNSDFAYVFWLML